MGKVKTSKIVLNESGYFLTRQKGCLVVKSIRTKEEIERYPILQRKTGEIEVVSGNLIATGALVTCAFNHIPVIVKTALGSPVGVLISIDDMSHVDTRCFQYEVMKRARASDRESQHLHQQYSVYVLPEEEANQAHTFEGHIYQKLPPCQTKSELS